MKLPPPPASVSDLVEWIGLDAALLLIEEYGGTRFWVPNGLAGNHRTVHERLEALIGKDATATLIRYYGGDKVALPLAKQWRMQVYAARGMSNVEIARRVKLAEYSVRRFLAGRSRQPNDLQFNLAV